MKQLFLSLLLLCGSSSLWAHALWIETKASGQTGQAHAVKVFYGEYAENNPEPISAWYSDVKAFTLWLVSPSGQKQQLAVDSAGNHFTASFTPSEAGSYQLLVSHSAKDLGRTTLYQFNTSATVTVGKGATAPNSNPLSFAVTPGEVKGTVDIKALFNQQPCADCKVMLVGPTGWSKEIAATAGVVSLKPEWKGQYMVEVTRSGKEAGEQAGVAYDAVWRCATMLVTMP
ncbi:MAG: hypothetical protein P0Y53_15315 [Candidatus Pseudobacter hemicellulosilyticus]|uniref:DUF4198 domain-containing protein n=1 Tax=Candidatus Pseudobacter hemicellulosilyticus TaxID=3121375 RepID=A0AAJ5WQF4_9BACT|nr:MAG: hypothetical protein P0Y53_15315 [Pseudobacter sp.]